jgi:hypothetical protein
MWKVNFASVREKPAPAGVPLQGGAGSLAKRGNPGVLALEGREAYAAALLTAKERHDSQVLPQGVEW